MESILKESFKLFTHIWAISGAKQQKTGWKRPISGIPLSFFAIFRSHFAQSKMSIGQMIKKTKFV